MKAEGNYSIEEMQVAASNAATQEGITSIEGNNHKIGVLLGCPDMLLLACEQLKAVADAIHYPDCWDTAAYPTLASAIQEGVSCNPDCCTKGGN